MCDVHVGKNLHTAARVCLRRNFSWFIFFSLLAPLARPAAAQTTADGKWEIEVHGGGILASNPTGGTASLPDPGESFTLRGALAARTSRSVSSWYFGDGTVLINQLGATRTATFAFLGVVTEKMTALDPILTRSVVQRQHGGSLGFRISRHINPRYTAEFGVDYSRGPLEISDIGLAGIEASRASFLSVFAPAQGSIDPQKPPPTNWVLPPGLLATGVSPGYPFAGSGGTSEATIHNREGHQIFTTGVLNVNLKTGGKMIPYASVGGGVVVNSGDTPSATLAGNYQIQLRPGTPLGPAGLVTHNETDTVDLRYSIEHRAFVGVLGGGVKYAVSPHWGVRLDVRADLSKNRISNLVDANPTVAKITTPLVLYILPPPGSPPPLNPTVVMSNGTGVPSSLSGTSINGFQTFSGNGISSHTNITAGVFWRF